VLTTSQHTQPISVSLHVYNVPAHSLSPLFDHLYLPHYRNHKPLFLDMHHLNCGTISPFRSVNLILFTLLWSLDSPHPACITSSQSPAHHLRSRHLSLPRPFTPYINLSVPQLLSSVVYVVPFGLSSRTLF